MCCDNVDYMNTNPNITTEIKLFVSHHNSLTVCLTAVTYIHRQLYLLWERNTFHPQYLPQISSFALSAYFSKHKHKKCTTTDAQKCYIPSVLADSYTQQKESYWLTTAFYINQFIQCHNIQPQVFQHILIIRHIALI